MLVISQEGLLVQLDEVTTERDAALGRVAELKAEVMPMRDAFGRCRAILGLGDCDDMPSVVSHVSTMQLELSESQGEVKRLSALLKVSVGTNGKLLARLRVERKEGGA